MPRGPQWEIKVLVGEDEEKMTATRQLAIAQHQALIRELGVFA